MFTWAHAIDLTKPVPEVKLAGGTVLRNVEFLAFADSAATARWENGRGAIAYKDLPKEIVAAIDARKPKPVVAAKTPEPKPAAKVEAPIPSNRVSLGDIDLRATDYSGSYVRYSWKAQVRNTTPIPKEIRAEIKLFDERGFEVDSDRSDTAYVRAGEAVTLTSSSLTKEALWTAVKRYEVRLLN